MYRQLVESTDNWLDEHASHQDVVVSSRIRLARNLTRIPFAVKAKNDELAKVADIISSLVESEKRFDNLTTISLDTTGVIERKYLKESRIISPEMERGGKHRLVYITPTSSVTILVNEEDHIRLQGLGAGLQLDKIMNTILEVDDIIIEKLPVAFSSQFGFLTACPSNIGTGLRISVMLHLPGLVKSGKIQEIIESLQPRGMIVRGFNGEHSEFMGDLYQVSNEFSLGKTEEEIVSELSEVAENIVKQEVQTRQKLFSDLGPVMEDIVWRAFGALTHARLMSTEEAMTLLSRIRMGIDRGFFTNIDHYKLNKLIIEIQPAHMEYRGTDMEGGTGRDLARATFLRNYFQIPVSRN